MKNRMSALVVGVVFTGYSFVSRQAPIQTPEIIIATPENYLEKIKSAKLPVILFYNWEDKWCTPCTKAVNIVNKLAGKFKDSLIFISLSARAWDEKNDKTDFGKFSDSLYLKQMDVVSAMAPNFFYFKHGKEQKSLRHALVDETKFT